MQALESLNEQQVRRRFFSFIESLSGLVNIPWRWKCYNNGNCLQKGLRSPPITASYFHHQILTWSYCNFCLPIGVLIFDSSEKLKGSFVGNVLRLHLIIPPRNQNRAELEVEVCTCGLFAWISRKGEVDRVCKKQSFSVSFRAKQGAQAKRSLIPCLRETFSKLDFFILPLATWIQSYDRQTGPHFGWITGVIARRTLFYNIFFALLRYSLIYRLSDSQALKLFIRKVVYCY